MSGLITLLTLLSIPCSGISFCNHLKRPCIGGEKNQFQKQSAILFTVVPPTRSGTAASLSRQANYNQPLRSATQSQLCPICLFNFFLAWLTLDLSFPRCSWWQHAMPYLFDVVSATEITHILKSKVKWPKYYNLSIMFNYALFWIKINYISQCFILDAYFNFKYVGLLIIFLNIYIYIYTYL